MKVDGNDVHAYQRNWQVYPFAELPRLFYVFDSDGDQSERIAAFNLADEDGQELVTMAEKLGVKSPSDNPDQEIADVQLTVHFGVTSLDPIRSAPEEARIQLLVNLYDGKNKTYSETFAMTWWSNPPLPGNGRQEIDDENPVDALPAAGAYLFVYSWLQKPQAELGLPFEANGGFLGKRVKNYSFLPHETAQIIARLKNRDTSRLSVFMGIGPSILSHPFSFRPIIECRDPSSNETKLLAGGGGGGSNPFYDYSKPEPPPKD